MGKSLPFKLANLGFEGSEPCGSPKEPSEDSRAPSTRPPRERFASPVTHARRLGSPMHHTRQIDPLQSATWLDLNHPFKRCRSNGSGSSPGMTTDVTSARRPPQRRSSRMSETKKQKTPN
ncbi:hypothetical protein V6N13_017219 [Hibiscus sabdariffa]